MVTEGMTLAWLSLPCYGNMNKTFFVVIIIYYSEAG